MKKEELETLAALGEQTMKQKVKLALHKRKLELIEVSKYNKTIADFYITDKLNALIDYLVSDVDNIKIGIIKGE